MLRGYFQWKDVQVLLNALTCLEIRVFWQQILSTFDCLKKCLFHLHGLLCRRFRGDSLFLQHIKCVVSLSPSLHSFWWKRNMQSFHHSFSICNVSLPPPPPPLVASVIFSVIVFQQFDYDMCWWGLWYALGVWVGGVWCPAWYLFSLQFLGNVGLYFHQL